MFYCILFIHFYLFIFAFIVYHVSIYKAELKLFKTKKTLLLKITVTYVIHNKQNVFRLAGYFTFQFLL